MALARSLVSSLFAAVLFSACGGKVVDAPLTSDGIGSPANPSPPAATAPPSPPAPVPSASGSAPPAGPLPTNTKKRCGLFDGDREQILAGFGRARSLGVYEVTAVVEECSGAGGLHLMLQQRAGCGTAKIVHFGEHTCMSDTPWNKGDRVVVGVAPEPGATEYETVWCLQEIKPWDGVARAIRKLEPSETDAQVLARYSCVP